MNIYYSIPITATCFDIGHPVYLRCKFLYQAYLYKMECDHFLNDICIGVECDISRE